MIDNDQMDVDENSLRDEWWCVCSAVRLGKLNVHENIHEGKKGKKKKFN